PLAACTLSKEFFGGMFGPLVLLYLVRDVGFSPGVLGSIFAVGGVSSLLGAMAVVPLARRFGRGASMIIGLLLFSGALFLIPMAQGPTLLAAALLVLQQIAGDGAATVYHVNLVSFRQESAPEALLGRVNASSEFLTLGAGLAGSLASGIAGEWIGVRATLFIGAAGTLFSVLLLIGSPVRRLTAERAR
ncbi:MAG TPA: MFS transporter, partial [Bryobacteraceae bacterium]|nr:MFS transporter [Bryobacteraceae bacterium]